MYEIKQAKLTFKCPACGKTVYRGDNYVEDEGVNTCVCVLPERHLIPMIKLIELNLIIERLRKENLEMRLDLGVLVDFPGGQAAKKILDKYRIRNFEQKPVNGSGEIIQLDLAGNELARFKDVPEASKALGIYELNIYDALEDPRNKNTAGGFLFTRAEVKKSKYIVKRNA